MALEFTFEAYGETVVARRLTDLGDRAVAAKPAFEAIATTLRGYEKRLFDSDGAFGAASGEPWKELAASTVRQKARHGQDPRILRATGRLHDSLTGGHDPDHIEDASDDGLLFGSRVPYGAIHMGAPRGDTHHVQRKPIQMNEGQKRYILKKLQRYVVTGEV